jgi:predicted nucleotidyltransferase
MYVEENWGDKIYYGYNCKYKTLEEAMAIRENGFVPNVDDCFYLEEEISDESKIFAKKIIEDINKRKQIAKENKIKEKLENKVKLFYERNPGYKIIYITLFGSLLYGTNTPNSDVDFKGIFVPPLKDIKLKQDLIVYKDNDTGDEKKNSKDDVDFELQSIYQFLEKVKDGETNALSILFSMFREDTIMLKTKQSDLIKENYESLLTYKVHSYLGYSLKQASQYGVRGDRVREIEDFIKKIYMFSDKIGKHKIGEYWEMLRPSILASNYTHIKYVFDKGANGEEREYLSVLGRLYDKKISFDYLLKRLDKIHDKYGDRSKNSVKGIDYRALSHSYRILIECKELMENKKIVYPLKTTKEILKIKNKELTKEECVSMIENKMEEIEKFQKTMEYKQVDYNELLLDILNNSF